MSEYKASSNLALVTPEDVLGWEPGHNVYQQPRSVFHGYTIIDCVLELVEEQRCQLLEFDASKVVHVKRAMWYISFA